MNVCRMEDAVTGNMMSEDSEHDTESVMDDAGTVIRRDSESCMIQQYGCLIVVFTFSDLHILHRSSGIQE